MAKYLTKIWQKIWKISGDRERACDERWHSSTVKSDTHSCSVLVDCTSEAARAESAAAAAVAAAAVAAVEAVEVAVADDDAAGAADRKDEPLAAADVAIAATASASVRIMLSSSRTNDMPSVSRLVLRGQCADADTNNR